jgi:hypothetical protein
VYDRLCPFGPTLQWRLSGFYFFVEVSQLSVYAGFVGATFVRGMAPDVVNTERYLKDFTGPL